ncbi:MAG: hypothetical protein R2827_07425 [Bdellovibrionales bacterium]
MPKESTSLDRSRECRRKNPDRPDLNTSMSFEPESRRIREFIAASRAALPKDRDTVVANIPNELEIGLDNWGEKLAEIGNSIKQRALKKQVYLGDNTFPQFDPNADFVNDPYRTQGYLIEVYYGETLLPNNKQSGWFYNRKTNTISISESIDPELLQQPDAQISIHFIEYHDGQDSEYYQGPIDTESDQSQGSGADADASAVK